MHNHTTNTDKGGNPELVRESQRRRFADVRLVDKVLQHDEEWRKGEQSRSAYRGCDRGERTMSRR